ncbi:hypothetical protein CDL12_25461 [Handroanthus impetiginosus]|uniref:MULE transposase domain-containing protein n=1 Tax=Handroanthus impetiginosus TaxID=429701 RepID=A0A2G9G9Q9_9LAMI|nr:hypothetical protein CDL12_25461 [Handroanthus impetiginosus]
MRIDGRNSSKYKIVSFVSEHNGYDLVSPSKTHMLGSHRAITIAQALQADDIDGSGIAPRARFALMAKQVGGRENVGFIYEDYKNYLRSKRTVQMRIGDTGCVLQYLQQRQLDNLNFFYAIQVDEDDLIANIIWADAQMIVDYAHFGDVVCFDTTYRKNKESQPFALFVGVNHHKQTIVFDQDVAMAKALAVKWPKTCHRLCIWHIYQNAAIHPSNIFSRFTSFSKDFSSCIYDYDEEEEFLNAWHEMLEKYRLQTNE